METIYNRAYILDIYDQEEVASVEFTCRIFGMNYQWSELTMVSTIYICTFPPWTEMSKKNDYELCIFQVIKPRPPWSRGNYCVFGL